MSNSKFIFVSSSSDMTESREHIAQVVERWLEERGMANAIATYLWEKETDSGRMLSARMPIQSQLLDSADVDVPFTLCLFGERCGVPLQDEIPADWERRIRPWRCGADGRGLVHPWPTSENDQALILDKGGFPLTGTVFELISACSVDPEHDNLVVGYVANRFIDRNTRLDDLFFNQDKERLRLRESAKNPREAKEIENRDHIPQVRALLNLLQYFEQNVGSLTLYATEAEMAEGILYQAQKKLRQHFGLTSKLNPFKATLKHWSIDDEHRLPGRTDLIKQVLRSIDAAKDRQSRSFILLKGRSGCGKSSLLQRGILARLQEDGASVLALRPTDLEAQTKDRDRLDVLWSRICSLVDGCSSEGIARYKRHEKMASRLIDVLGARGARLVIGLDQFEEILDELSLYRSKRQQNKGWSHVMRFLACLSDCPQIQLIATLETTRTKTFETLGIEKSLGLERETHSADVTADDVAQIAKQGFSLARLTLDRSLVEEIKTKWETFEEENARDGRSASPLPLVCLWLSKTFDRFEDRAVVDVRPGDEPRSALRQASDSQVITLDDLGGAEKVAFGDTIAELAEEAWLQAGNSAIADIPIDEDPRKFSTLATFLQPMIGLDDDGHMRLLAVPEKALGFTNCRLRASFKQSRLLVPAGEARQADVSAYEPHLRLVHQSVIDRWEPARKWFEWQQAYLRTENEIRLEAKKWALNGRRKPRASKSRIQQAAQVLQQQRVDWPGRAEEALDRDDCNTRAYAIAVFQQATKPLTVIESSIVKGTYMQAASYYGLADLIRRFADEEPECLRSTDAEGTTCLSNAAWLDGPTVSLLLELGASLKPNKFGWHPIEGAIQSGAMQNYHALIPSFDNLDSPTGPNGYTMLHTAARYGNCAVIDDLLSRNVDCNKPNGDGTTALIWAASAGELRAFQRLLPVSDVSACTTDTHAYSALCYAAQNGYSKIIRAALDSHSVDEAALEEKLNSRNGIGCTPLMVAALFKRPNALRELLGVCEPHSAEHIKADDSTLFHLAVTKLSGDKIFDDEKLRARRTVELLIEDGRLDTMLLNKQEQTAFEVGGSYEDARRVLRRQMPLEYAEMSATMRLADLEARNPADILRLIRTAPQTLADTHGKLTGIEILLRDKKVKVLTVSLFENLLGDDLLQTNIEAFAELANSREASELRNALIRRLPSLNECSEVLPVLLDAALGAYEEDSIDKLIELGALTLRGAGKVQASVFHVLAIESNQADFKKLAQKHRFVLPLDAWGRRPSEVSAAATSSTYRELEDELFDVPSNTSVIELKRATKFHRYAKDGDVKMFERQARGSSITLPRDEEGHKPSDVADDEHRAAIAALEIKHFMKVN